MISKIQLGGITRRPSDLSAKEGACEESLNVTLDVNEVAPVIEPEDRTSELVGDTSAVESNTSDRYIYIHKTGAYENYIALDDSTNQVWAYINGERSGESGSGVTPIASLYNEIVKDVTAVGNTLIISTDENLHYILYKDGAYLYLGTKIPEPLVEFRALPATGIGVRMVNYEDTGISTYVPDNFFTWLRVALESSNPADFINNLCRQYGSTITYNNKEYEVSKILDSLTDFIWEQYYDMRNLNATHEVFSSAVFLRSAIMLYDGSYVYQSIPYLMHTGGNYSFSVNLYSPSGSNAAAGLTFRLPNFYQAKITITYPDLGNWSDIVRSVDVFASTDICNPKVSSRVDGAENLGESGNPTTFLRFLGQTSLTDYSETEGEILSKVNFYLMESKNIEEIGSGLSFMLKPVRPDDLLVKTTLPDDNLSHHKKSPSSRGGITTYNFRLAVHGLVTSLYPGYPFLQSTLFFPAEGRINVFEQDYIEFRYFLRTENGDSFSVIGRTPYGRQFTYPMESVGGVTYYGLPCGFLYYPDPRCYKCEIYYGNSSSPVYAYSVPMKEHPGLNGAYSLTSLDCPVTEPYSTDAGLVTYPDTESPVLPESNILIMSEAMNPFTFLLTNRQTFADSILAVATTTKALSTGQFGQFPLYVFTDGGIWAVPITDTGSMSSAVPLSRDVALSSESVTPIDQAIVFVTKKGVMLLTGSDIQDISPEMDGRHYSIDFAAVHLLYNTIWENYLGILEDRTPFIDFMKDAHAVYDYAGRRLVFFNDNGLTLRSYQYVYKMDTSSWHKQSLLQTGYGSANILNGYPEALVCFRNGSGVYRVCDLSVKYNPSGQQNTLPQIVITRPFNFNLPYVSKTLKRLFVKGRFDKGDVKYILLGSRDGKDYHVIHSLRGPSNNTFFRVIMLGTLAPEERVAYIEMDYEPRFTDKGR